MLYNIDAVDGALWWLHKESRHEGNIMDKEVALQVLGERKWEVLTLQQQLKNVQNL